MIFGSVCSGIEAASVAWEPLGWKAAWFSEIEPFPSAVLKHHYPDTPNLGDMTKIHEHENFKQQPIDLLVGGTPCQSFSVAGLRKGLDDPRGNLALEFLRLVDIKKPKWFVWENVPGVLSSGHGRDFGSFLGAVQKLGYGFAYRILDAQYFGVPQKRRRVFVVGCFGDWRSSAATLFEEHLPINAKSGSTIMDDTLRATNDLRYNYRQGNKSGTLQLRDEWRYLSPLECERVQGFPDNYTRIEWETRSKNGIDALQYQVLGNSMAVPVMRWIGERVKKVEEILQ